MTTYLFGEEKIEAATAAELVRKMRATAVFDESRSDSHWMKLVAHRATVSSGADVRTGSAEEFVEDLVAAGLLVREGGSGV